MATANITIAAYSEGDEQPAGEEFWLGLFELPIDLKPSDSRNDWLLRNVPRNTDPSGQAFEHDSCLVMAVSKVTKIGLR